MLGEGADVRPFSGAGEGVDGAGCGAESEERFGSEEGGDYDESVFVEAVEEGMGRVGLSRHFWRCGEDTGGGCGDNSSCCGGLLALVFGSWLSSGGSSLEGGIEVITWVLLQDTRLKARGSSLW